MTVYTGSFLAAQHEIASFLHGVALGWPDDRLPGAKSLGALATPVRVLYQRVHDLQNKSMAAKDTSLEKGQTIRMIAEGFFN